ncbi:MAG: putative PEP-binding protein, partial [Xanthomonadales bacterium]|nr:putative PEP-binding protein [Xanthomonadales bacterium]
MTLALSGHAVSPGIAIGQAHLIHRNEIDIGEHRIAPEQVDAEIARLRESLDAAREHLSGLAASLHERGGETAEDVVRTHIQMLEDSSLTGGAEDHVRQQLCNAEWALQLQLEGLLSEFRKVEDDYLRGRAEDVSQVVRLVQRMLASGARAEDPAIPDRLVETLVVASELAPGELAALHQRGVAGVITEHGSPHSHSAIVARSLGIPAVMGVHRAQALLREGESLVLDGHYGVGFASPDERLVRHYLAKQAGSQRYQDTLLAVRDQPARTADGVALTLLANAERDVDLKEAVANGATGVGLFRTENLYLQGRAPMEEQQLAAFRMALAILGERPLTIRTLDLGADRSDGRLNFTQLRHVTNPALGLRAVRLCLREQDLFRTQLRAILRASAAGPVRCLIPMLTSVHEVRMVRALIDEARHELDQRYLSYDRDMSLGGMIEVPAAA